jgi:hypothetical protein
MTTRKQIPKNIQRTKTMQKQIFCPGTHLKQFGKTLIQAIRIEFPNLRNAIRQKVRQGD